MVVTNFDRSAATCGSPTHCAVARSINRIHPGYEVSVLSEWAFLGEHLYPLTARAREYIRKFDRGQRVPKTFITVLTRKDPHD